MEINLNREDLTEVRNLINNFTIKMKDETSSIPALCYCLDALIKAEKDLERYFNEND